MRIAASAGPAHHETAPLHWQRPQFGGPLLEFGMPVEQAAHRDTEAAIAECEPPPPTST
jgi:hypothetical protein